LHLASRRQFLQAGSEVAAPKELRLRGAYGLFAALSSLALWLAFFPPKAYVRWVESAKESSRG
jgi:hypothetical protein